MKSKVLIIISALALLVNIAVQVYLINGLYRLRNDAFDAKYQKTLSEGIGSLRTYYNKTGFDSAFYALDYTALDILNSYRSLPDGSAEDSLNVQALTKVKDLLYQNDYLTPYLKSYLKAHKMDDDFSSKISIKQFVLLDIFDAISIINDSSVVAPGISVVSGNRSVLLVSSFRMEGNYYKLRFDYLVDFHKKFRIILLEMLTALVLSLFSVIVTGLIFFITLRNMMKHKQLSMMKTDFINNMAHELKTPLTTIAVASSTLAEHSVQADVKKVNELSGLIKQQNNHLGRLIDQILDINIWERDRIALQKSEVHLKSFFEKILKGFELENDGKDFNLIKMIQFGDESMELDGFKFSLAVRNLLSNALKYGGKIPEVELKAGMSGGEVKIEISDNGSGITKEEQKHIFDKFYRGQNSKQGIKGLGLGLYYVKKIVEMHGGMIGIKNRNNKGTTFIVTVPYENHVVKI